MSKTVVGVDPGWSSGAVAIVGECFAEVHDLPLVEGHGIDEIALADLISGDGIAAAFVERVASRPGEGVASSFKFGQAFGSIKATVRLARLPLHLPTPAQWKRKHGLSKDKEASRRLALDLFPSLAERLRRKKDADRAEALLIAAYGREALL